MTRTHSRSAPGRELTLEEYLALPEIHGRWEVIDGVIVMAAMPTGGHQWILGNLYRGIFTHVSDHGLGIVFFAPGDVLIRTEPKLRVRQPDLMYFSAERTGFHGLKEIRGLKIFDVAPDLAIEILSPSDTKKRLAEKLADYASIGIPELWLVAPKDETVEVLALREGRYERAGLFRRGEMIISPVLPGLELAVDAVFA